MPEARHPSREILSIAFKEVPLAERSRMVSRLQSARLECLSVCPVRFNCGIPAESAGPLRPRRRDLGLKYIDQFGRVDRLCENAIHAGLNGRVHGVDDRIAG